MDRVEQIYINRGANIYKYEEYNMYIYTWSIYMYIIVRENCQHSLTIVSAMHVLFVWSWI